MTQAVQTIVETKQTAWHTEELSDKITDRLQEDGSTTPDREYGQSSLSADLKEVYEPLGIVHRTSKANSDDSTIFTTPGIIDFLDKQNWDALQLITPADTRGRAFENIGAIDTEAGFEARSVMTYLQEMEIRETDEKRHREPMEAVIYKIASEYSSLLGKEVFVEYGSPTEFSETANDMVERLYSEGQFGDPLPVFPQHKDNDRYSKATYFSIVGCVRQVDVVKQPYILRSDIVSQLKTWTGGAFELSFRQYAESHSTSATEDAIDDAINGLIEGDRNQLKDAELFKSRAFVDGDELVFGTICRTNESLGKGESFAEQGAEDEQATDD